MGLEDTIGFGGNGVRDENGKLTEERIQQVMWRNVRLMAAKVGEKNQRNREGEVLESGGELEELRGVHTMDLY